MTRRIGESSGGGGTAVVLPAVGLKMSGAVELLAGTDIVLDAYPEQRRIVIRSTAAGGGPHAANHQNGGSDEVSVAGLSGVLADAQTPAAHGHALADLAQGGATAGQVPKWNGSAWAPANDETGGGAAREILVAHWTDPRTKTNIGTSFVNIYSGTNEAGFECDVDFTGTTQVKAIVTWNKVGTGTQTIRAVQADDVTKVLFSMDVVSGRNVFALAALPAWATGVKRIMLQGKSTTGTDDPIFGSCALYLK